MGKKKNLIQEESYYHIYNRGNNRGNIFLEDENYRFFLERLQTIFDKAGLILVAYCLMPNHFHLLIFLEKSVDLGNIMRSFSNSYVRSFNNRYRRSGHLYEDDYKPKRIDSDEYLSHLCRYIHLNPVSAGLVSLPEKWVFSDYNEWISDSQIGKHRVELRNRLFDSAAGYRRFVMDFHDVKKVENKLKRYLFS